MSVVIILVKYHLVTLISTTRREGQSQTSFLPYSPSNTSPGPWGGTPGRAPWRLGTSLIANWNTPSTPAIIKLDHPFRGGCQNRGRRAAGLWHKARLGAVCPIISDDRNIDASDARKWSPLDRLSGIELIHKRLKCFFFYLGCRSLFHPICVNDMNKEKLCLVLLDSSNMVIQAWML